MNHRARAFIQAVTLTALLLTLAEAWRQGPVHAGTLGDPIPKLSGGKEIYHATCSACHGPAGEGAPQSTVGFDTPLPDFTDCTFASREPSPDWVAVVHEGGPRRAFSPIMPAFGEALSLEQMQAVVEFLRGFCKEPAWPRGELNLPLALVTGKAFPEDEALLTSNVSLEGPAALSHVATYEKRFGARNQVEAAIPFRYARHAGDDWGGGVGDIKLGYKRALVSSLRTGSIFSAAAEIAFPTGDPDRATGKGVTVFEPYLAYGQLLPADSFVQFQAGAELPTHEDDASKEVFWRTAFGRTFAQNRGFGRAWTPMIEVLAAREVESGAEIEWDLLPQVQFTLSKRQHVMANVGIRFPVTQTGSRSTALVFYLLWDTFDGGLFEGWR